MRQWETSSFLSVNHCAASIRLASLASLHYMIKHGWPSQIYKDTHTHTHCIVLILYFSFLHNTFQWYDWCKCLRQGRHMGNRAPGCVSLCKRQAFCPILLSMQWFCQWSNAQELGVEGWESVLAAPEPSPWPLGALTLSFRDTIKHQFTKGWCQQNDFKSLLNFSFW